MKPPKGERCPRCLRFCRWRRRYTCWLSRCCHAERLELERGPVRVEVVREGVIAGVPFMVAIRRSSWGDS